MEVIDFNGEGRWSRVEILARYERYAAELGIPPCDLTPKEHSEPGRRWIYPVMAKVIEGTPKVETFELLRSTFPKFTAKGA